MGVCTNDRLNDISTKVEKSELEVLEAKLLFSLSPLVFKGHKRRFKLGSGSRGELSVWDQSIGIKRIYSILVRANKLHKHP